MLLLFHAIFRHNKVLGPIAPLVDGRAVGILPLTHYELDRVVFTVACEECDCFIAGADRFELPVDVTLGFDELVRVFEGGVLRAVLVDHFQA